MMTLCIIITMQSVQWEKQSPQGAHASLLLLLLLESLLHAFAGVSDKY